jgi:2,4-dienoyl-CoA reductase-like NADH-dependent reductase (Old Yellow Enzyme family)
MKTSAEFRAHVAELGVDIRLDDAVLPGPSGPLAQTYRLPDGYEIGNRFCVHPMEGWDGTSDGRPSDLTLRRWRNFGRSGAKLIWGCEAVAVEHAGRANPRQLLINRDTVAELAAARESLVAKHEMSFGRSDDLLVGLQLTHSGRYARPNAGASGEPRILYRHPQLDRRAGIDTDDPILSDAEVGAIIGRFVEAACLAYEAGFAFVDIKHCHGYLGNEFLSAYTRPGPYGGSFENRTAFLREVVDGVRRRSPHLRIGVRLSAFDAPPFRAGEDGVGEPEAAAVPYPYVFGADHDAPLRPELSEVHAFLSLLNDLGIDMVNISAGNPYTTPHLIRPALFPPSDGYLPPEDPLVGVARQIGVCAELALAHPRLLVVGSAYTYLQEFLPNVAQHNVRTGRVDFVGLGRMVLPYPELPADVLQGRPLDRRRVCRTFSDCTSAPRAGMVSGCYPLDRFYKARPESERVAALRHARRR